MSQHDTCDGDAEGTRVGEVGQHKPAGLVLLTEDHILLGTGQASPRAHSPFHRAPSAVADLRSSPPDLLVHRNGPNSGRRLPHCHDLAFPYRSQCTPPPTSSPRFL